MGDRTSATFYVYSCPPQQTWAIAEMIERYRLTDTCAPTYKDETYGAPVIGPGPWELGYIEPDTEYQGYDVSCGSASEIAGFLQRHAPDARWDVWEEPGNEFLGERFINDPDLGLWKALCDPEGRPCYSARALGKWLDKALTAEDRDAARAEIDRERGKPWLEMAAREHDKRIIEIGPDPDDL